MKSSLVLVSGYGAPGEEDMALYRIGAAGQAQKLYGLCHGRSPSFCCRGGNGWIYAVSERPDGADITAYELKGEAMELRRRLTVPGCGLCHLHACGDILFGSCYESGDFFAVDAELGKVLWSFSCPKGHAHWAYTVGGLLYLADPGNDSLYRYKLYDGLPAGEGEVLRQPCGSGPRQVLTLGNGKTTCINENDGMIRVLNGEGKCEAAEPASGVTEKRNWPGGACLDGQGTLYVCNRGPNTVAAWRWEKRGLSKRSEWPVGDWPRHIAVLSRTGYVAVACMRSHEVVGYSCGAGMPRQVFRLPLSGASCVLEL